MARNNTYLIVNGAVTLSTVIAMAILMASTAYAVSGMVVNIVFELLAGLGLISLMISLLLGCHGLVKSLSLLGCEHWNIRMVRGAFILQLILLVVGLALYAVSLLFIR